MANVERLDVDASSDADSGLGDDHSALSASLSSSILNYTYSNGRRYHAYRAGAYLLPNDEGEQERLDFNHHIWRMVMDGNLHVAKLDQPQRILDIGTGTGIWAIDMADEYPEAEVIGTDLSPIQPTWAPSNCQFYVDDAESPWTFDAPFDFIHCRSMGGSIADWNKFYEQMFENLKPGGMVEIHEYDSWMYALEKEPPWTAEWNVNMNLATERFGKPLNVAKLHAAGLKAAGFEDVEETFKKAPIGKWSKTMKDIGVCQTVNLVDAIEPYTLMFYTKVLGKSLEETKVVIEMVKKELQVKDHHLYTIYRFITARKPR